MTEFEGKEGYVVSVGDISIWQVSDHLTIGHNCHGGSWKVKEFRSEESATKTRFECVKCKTVFSKPFFPFLRGGVESFLIQKWAASWLGVDEARVTVTVRI